MKSTFLITFLFLFSIVFSQTKIENLTSITFSKIYEQADDCSCNIFENSQCASFVSKSIYDCDDLVLELIKFKENFKNLKKLENCCQDSFMAMGCPSYQNRLIFQYNKYKDTLLFNESDIKKEGAIFYTKKYDYYDSNNEIDKILSKSEQLNSFHNTNVEELFREAFYDSVLDSINIKKLKINNRNFYGLNRNMVDSLISGFHSSFEIERDLDTKKDSYKYYSNNQDTYNEYYFVNDNPIDKIIVKRIENEYNYDTDGEVFNINGIIFNDSEKVLIEKFPNSTKYIENQKAFFKDKDENYIITIEIMESKGTIDFVLNNEKIKEIQINFHYLND